MTLSGGARTTLALPENLANSLPPTLETLSLRMDTAIDLFLGELPNLQALRTLRIMHHAKWLAERWSDPAFPKAFPWFGQGRFWSDHILELREQLAAMNEAPLRLL